MITYKYNYKKGYIETFFSGNVGQGEAIRYFSSLLDEENLPTNLKVLINIDYGALKIEPTNLIHILNENLKLFTRYNTLKIAIITKSPVDTAIAILYTRLIHIERYKLQVFSTEFSAQVWLNKGLDANQNKIYPKISYSSYSMI
jgi:hypothetical protein